MVYDLTPVCMLDFLLKIHLTCRTYIIYEKMANFASFIHLLSRVKQEIASLTYYRLTNCLGTTHILCKPVCIVCETAATFNFAINSDTLQ